MREREDEEVSRDQLDAERLRLRFESGPPPAMLAPLIRAERIRALELRSNRTPPA